MEMTCNVCYALGDRLAQLVSGRSGCAVLRGDCSSRWPRARSYPAAVPRGGVGQLQLRIEGDTLADLDLAVCGPCRRAVLEQVRVDEEHRRFWVWPSAGCGCACPGPAVRVSMVNHDGQP